MIKKTKTTIIKNIYKVLLKIIFLITLLSALDVQAFDVVYPENRTTIEVSAVDINRIYCENGNIESIDYTEGFLEHNLHNNRKNLVFLFKQITNGINTQSYNKKAMMLINCNNNYYSLILNPKSDIKSKTIYLKISDLEKNVVNFKKTNLTKSKEEIIIDLIIKSRDKNTYNNGFSKKNNDIKYLENKIEAHHQSSLDINGTLYEIQKWLITTSDLSDIKLDESIFITAIPNLAAISLDDYYLTKDKQHTYAHLIVYRDNSFDINDFYSTQEKQTENK